VHPLHHHPAAGRSRLPDGGPCSLEVVHASKPPVRHHPAAGRSRLPDPNFRADFRPDFRADFLPNEGLTSGPALRTKHYGPSTTDQALLTKHY
jgi:hypothetical protein